MERGRNRCRSHFFPILDIWSRFRDIRDQSRKLSKIALNFGRFFGGAEFAGQENDGQRNFRGWKLQDWKLTDKSVAGKNVEHVVLTFKIHHTKLVNVHDLSSSQSS